MECKILHESRGRLRIHVGNAHMTLRQADILEYYMKEIDGVSAVSVHDRTGNAVIRYTCDRNNIFEALSQFEYQQNERLVPEHTARELNRYYQDKLAMTVLRRCFCSIFLPAHIKNAIIAVKSLKYIATGIKTLWNRKLEVEVIDAAAIAVSIVRGDFKTAGSVMFLLKIGAILEGWTRKKSVDDLAKIMALNVDKVWLKTGEQEILTSVAEISVGEHIVVRTGNMIPLDGKVVCGDASVNQGSITGESIPVHKCSGSYVYAGTVVEEGECVICVDKDLGGGRYDRIVRMIEESEKLKSSTEANASRLADCLVPYSLGGTIITYLLTRNAMKAVSILMVDFSCALKLSMPLAVLSAMREAGANNISVKGGKYLESVANADTIVFDKTGTLTNACPKVAKIIVFNGESEDEVLRLAACLEEHYPHSIANAVVMEAKGRGLHHEERHSKVEYVVAHGISSIVENKKVVIGSYHFVFEDERCTVPETGIDKFNQLPDEYSHLYLATSGVLSAVICIEDPLREEAESVISSLRLLGIDKIVMMTGDSERTAKSIAARVGVDRYYSDVLPEEKAAFVRNEQKKGRTVIMIGDGVNDSPALSEADAGIAIANCAAIAREIADITITAEDLYALVTLKKISNGLLRRIKKNYRFIISFNGLLIGLGILGIITPSASALLHNISTIGISLQSMTNLLED